MAAFWEQLEARQLPTETVLLPIEGGTVDVALRALLPAEWDALCEAYPATGEGVEPGAIDSLAMRPALLAASVVAPEGSPPKDPAWWEALAKRGGATAGELDALFNTAWVLNRRAPMGAELGKD